MLVVMLCLKMIRFPLKCHLLSLFLMNLHPSFTCLFLLLSCLSCQLCLRCLCYQHLQLLLLSFGFQNSVTSNVVSVDPIVDTSLTAIVSYPAQWCLVMFLVFLLFLPPILLNITPCDTFSLHIPPHLDIDLNLVVYIPVQDIHKIPGFQTNIEWCFQASSL